MNSNYSENNQVVQKDDKYSLKFVLISNFVVDRKNIEMVDLKKIYAVLFEMGVISLIKDMNSSTALS